MNSLATALPGALRPALPFLTLLLSVPLVGQQPDYKPAPTPDPEKGMHDMSPLTEAELAMRRGARPPHAAAATSGPVLRSVPLPVSDRVLFDAPGDGRIWARGTTYKASFGREGAVYVPFFGSDAPRNFPVHFVLRAVRVGGEPLALGAAEPQRSGDRITFARGAVREIYDLAPMQIEQTFVVDGARPGDVEIELEVVSELAEDAATGGIQFGNALGQVHYGAAFLVDGLGVHEIASTYADGTIRMRVPAAVRSPGAVVIDPIINSSAFTSSLSQDSGQPDIAYDATSDTYLGAWQYHFSASDIDVYSQFWNGDGTTVANSIGIIDISTLSHTNPRVANLNAYDRFLVVMQRFEAGRWQIWGRLRLAGNTPHPIVFQISDPAFSGHCINPDIGGDPGNGDHWLVVWQRELSATDFDIHARLVRGDISLAPATILIENSANTIHSMPQVSQSNGNGFTGAPRWMVVYQFRFSATDEDIYGAAIAPNGLVTTSNRSIDRTLFTDLVPSVSSPATDISGGNPMYMVTYERQSPLEARALLLSESASLGFANQINPVSLTQAFGLGPFWVRAESDGCRFAVISGAATITVATFAQAGTSLVLHDAPQSLPVVTPSYPRIASRRSGGGLRTDYGIVYVDENWFPDRIVVSTYRGHASSADFTRRVMGCHGLGIDVAGRAMLGESFTISLANVGSDLPGIVVSLPVPASTSVCATCPIGVALPGASTTFGPTRVLSIPCAASLVGFTGAVQGFGFGSGPCVATLRFSDTIDFTIG